MIEQHIALLTTIYEGYGRGDLGPMLAAVSDDVRFGVSAPERQFRWAGVRTGRAWVERVAREIGEDYEWLAFRCREIISQGDRAVALTGGRLRHRASGAELELDLIDVVRFAGDTIVEWIEYFDTGTAFSHIEAAAQPPAAADAVRRTRSRPKLKSKPKAGSGSKSPAKSPVKSRSKARGKGRGPAPRRTSR